MVHTFDQLPAKDLSRGEFKGTDMALYPVLQVRNILRDGGMGVCVVPPEPHSATLSESQCYPWFPRVTAKKT